MDGEELHVDKCTSCGMELTDNEVRYYGDICEVCECILWDDLYDDYGD